jgi:hypothetical protein
MRMILAISILAAAAVGMSEAHAQTSMFGQVGDWYVTKSDAKQCWLLTATNESVFALTLDKQGSYGIAFSVRRSTPAPQVIEVGISAMDVPFSSDKYQVRKPFTNVINRGNEAFYQASLTSSEFGAIRARTIVTFTEMLNPRRPYSNISAVHKVEYDPAADQLWRRCVASLAR